MSEEGRWDDDDGAKKINTETISTPHGILLPLPQFSDDEEDEQKRIENMVGGAVAAIIIKCKMTWLMCHKESKLI